MSCGTTRVWVLDIRYWVLGIGDWRWLMRIRERLLVLAVWVVVLGLMLACEAGSFAVVDTTFTMEDGTR